MRGVTGGEGVFRSRTKKRLKRGKAPKRRAASEEGGRKRERKMDGKGSPRITGAKETGKRKGNSDHGGERERLPWILQGGG